MNKETNSLKNEVYIGPNGVGKSTALRTLEKKLKSDLSNIEHHKVIYVPTEQIFDAELQW